MRLVVSTEPGIVELAYTWLPTWLGINTAIKQKLEAKLQSEAVGKPMTEEVLQDLHEKVLDFFVEEFPQITGLRDYLDGIKFIQF
jgi:uncharacterized protein YndB with AHSA1/START domain